MASIRRRGKKFQVQIRRQGHAPVSRSFAYLADAKAWAREVERNLDRGYRVENGLSKATLGQILDKYLTEITSQKRGRLVETRRINRLLRDPICHTGIKNLSSHVIATFRDRRLADGAPPQWRFLRGPNITKYEIFPDRDHFAFCVSHEWRNHLQFLSIAITSVI